MAGRPLSTLPISRKLSLSQMMVFARVLDSGSFVRAANELGLTQPAISKAIAEMVKWPKPMYSSWQSRRPRPRVDHVAPAFACCSSGASWASRCASPRSMMK